MTDERTSKQPSVESRLKVLEDERAIQATLYAYGHNIDYGLKEQFADLFAEDASYLVLRQGVPYPSLGGVPQTSTGIKGRAQILTYVRAHTNAPNKWHKHFMVEPVIRWQNDNEVTVESYLARLDEDENGAYISSFGRYRDRLVRTSDEKWRFKSRICEVENRPPKR